MKKITFFLFYIAIFHLVSDAQLKKNRLYVGTEYYIMQAQLAKNSYYDESKVQNGFGFRIGYDKFVLPQLHLGVFFGYLGLKYDLRENRYGGIGEAYIVDRLSFNALTIGLKFTTGIFRLGNQQFENSLSFCLVNPQKPIDYRRFFYDSENIEITSSSGAWDNIRVLEQFYIAYSLSYVKQLSNRMDLKVGFETKYISRSTLEYTVYKLKTPNLFNYGANTTLNYKF